MPRVRHDRPTAILFALSAFASVAVAVTGTLLLWCYREATLAASAEREALLGGRAEGEGQPAKGASSRPQTPGRKA